MTRFTFGGTDDAYIHTKDSGNVMHAAPASVMTWWSAITGGTQYTDLLLNGSPATTITADANGYIPLFSGPDGVTQMWGSADGSARKLLVANNASAASNLVFNVLTYGADPTGITATGTQIQACFDAAYAAGGTVLMPPGIYLTSSTVVLKTGIDARGASLYFTSTGSFEVGPGSGVTLFAAHLHLPAVMSQTTSSGMSGQIGLVLRNLNSCEVYVPRIQQFSYGLYCQGLGTGFAYNNVRIGSLWLNQKQIYFDPTGTGWVNQNTFYGGRVQSAAAGSQDTAAADVYMGQGIVSNPNGNTFIGTSFEGNITAQYRIQIEGTYNRFIGCRWEAMGGDNVVQFGATAQKNVIDGGYEAQTLTRHDVTGQANNKILTPWI